MAKKRVQNVEKSKVDVSRTSIPPVVERIGSTEGVTYTGRQLVLMPSDSSENDANTVLARLGMHDMVRSQDFAGGAVDMEQAGTAEALYLNELKIMVVSGNDPDKITRLSSISSTDRNILATEPERMNHHCGLSNLNEATAEYIRGYRDAINQFAEQLLERGGTKSIVDSATLEEVQRLVDNSQSTWGLQATKVDTSRFTGQGIKVAVLDTGFDFNHPDFPANRIGGRQSFISGQTEQDGHGHGTHCIGTSCGPQNSVERRYGCAFQADIYVGKVLSDQGSGADQGILTGINWAISNGCRIISMSLGSPTQPGESFSPIYEALARRAISKNTLIIAAAGNESQRPGVIRPVGRPANCPSIMSVAALNSDLSVAFFSNGGINPNGGNVDIAGPGGAPGIYSAAPMPKRYQSMQGTSMATPHVAGIAALWLSANPNLTASGLRQQLISTAKPLNLPDRDVGAGLAQAPQ